MTLGAVRIQCGTRGQWSIARQPGPDLAALLIGRPVAEVAALLPRLFNLCRKAQEAAVLLALGQDPRDDTRAEVVQDHRARLGVTLRRAFDLEPLRMPDPLAQPLPRTLPELWSWIDSPQPLADLARAVAQSFPPGLGRVPALPFPEGAETGAFENSPAGRQAGHPLLRALEAEQGRSPLWRLMGLLVDLDHAATLPGPALLAQGTARVQAARGAYVLRLGHLAGIVTDLHRITPTDHQLWPGGALARALETLPGDRPDLARRLIALHDPCIPAEVTEPQHA